MGPTRTAMRVVRRAGVPRLLLFLALLTLGALPALAGLSNTSDWPMLGGTPGHTGEAADQLPSAGTIMGIEWARQLGSAVPATPAVSDDQNYLIVGTADGRVVWLEITNNGAVNYTVQLNTKTPFLSTPLVDKNAGRVYLGNANGRLYAVQRGTPNPLWVAPAVGQPPWGPLVAAPIFNGDDILVASMDGCIYKVTAADGSWVRIYGPVSTAIESTPVLGTMKAAGAVSALAADLATPGLTSVQVVDASLFDPGDELKIGPNPGGALGVGYITRIDTVNNILYFSVKTTAVIGAAGNNAYSTPHQPLYFAGENGRVYAINADEIPGHLRWVYPDPPGKAAALLATPVMLDATHLFIGDVGGNFYCINAYSGKLASMLDAATLNIGRNLTTTTGRPVNNQLFVGGTNGLVAIDVTNPAAMVIQRKYTVLPAGVVTQPVVGKSDKVLVGTSTGVVYALDNTADTDMWHWTPARKLTLTGSPLLVKSGPDRRVLLVSREGDVISLLKDAVTPLPALGKVPAGRWPQYQLDPAHPGALNTPPSGFTAPLDGMASGEYTGRKLRWVAPTSGNVRSSAAVTRMSEVERTAVLQGAIAAPPVGTRASTTITVVDASALHVGDPVIIGDDYLGPIASITRTPADPAVPDTLVVTDGPQQAHADGDLMRVSAYRRDTVVGGDIHAEGSPQVGIAAGAPQGTIWYDNSPVYNPRGLVFSLHGVLTPRFTKDDGTDLTTFAPAPGGEEVRFGFLSNDPAIQNPTSQAELNNPTYLYVFLTDNGHIGIRRKVAPGADPQEIDVAIPGAATYALASGVEVVLAVRPTDVNKAQATAYYRLADSKGKFPDDFSGFTPIGSYNLPSGLSVANPAIPPIPPTLYDDVQLPALGTGLYPFLRAFDTNALLPGYDVTARGTEVIISYDPIADVNVVGPGSSYVKIASPERFLPGDRVEIFHPTDPGIHETFTVGGVTNSYISIQGGLKNSYPPGSLVRAGRPGAWAAFVGSDDGFLRALDPDTGAAIWKSSANSYLGAVRCAPVIDEGHGRVYVVSAAGRLFAFAQNGQWLWAYPSVLGPALGPISVSPVLDEDGNVYFATESGYINKVTPDGELATSSVDPAKYTLFPASPDPALSPIVGLALYRAAATADPADLRLVAATRNGKVYLLDGNLTKKYCYPDDMAAPQPAMGTLMASPVVAADGTIIIGDVNGKVHAFYEDIPTTSLKSRWLNSAIDPTPIQYQVEGPVIAAAATAEGVVYVADGPDAVDPAKGKKLYAITGQYTADFAAPVQSKQLDAPPAGPLSLDANGNLLVTTEAGSVYCFAPIAGNDDPLWRWNTRAPGGMPLALPLRTAPALWLGNLVIVGGDDGNIYGIGPRGEVNPANPALSIATPGGPWPLAYRDPHRTSAQAEWLAPEPGPKQPSLRWFADTGGRLGGAPVVSDRTPDKSTRVYQGTNSGKVIAYDASTGEARWTTPLIGEGPVRAAAAVHVDGTVAVAGMDGHVYLLNNDGTLKWDSQVANTRLYGGFLAAPIRAANGSIVVATADRLDIIGTYSTVGGNPNDAAGLLTALTDGLNATEVDGATSIDYDLGRQATVTRVRLRTANGGELYFFRDGAWSLYGSFGETAAARYLTVDANRGASKVRWVNRSAANIAVQAFEIYANDGPKLTALNLTVDGAAGALPSNGAVTDLTPNAAPAIYAQRARFTTMSKGELHVIDMNGDDITVAKYDAQAAATTYDVILNRLVKKVTWQRDPGDTSTLDVFELYGADGGRVLLFNDATGVLLNSYPPVGTPLGPVVASMAASGDTLFLATADGEAVALKLADLSEVWRKPLGEAALSPVTISATDTGVPQVVLITQDGTVRTWDTAGNPVFASPWQIPGTMSNAPALTTQMSGNARWAFLINDRGQIYRINLNSTNPPDALGELPTNVKSSPALDSTGLLYVGSETGALYCLDTKDIFVQRFVQGVPQLAIGIKWTYFPDRSSLTTALYDDTAPGTFTLRVNAIGAFRVGDAVQITRPDGSMPQDLGRVTDISPPNMRTAFAGISGMAQNGANSAVLDFTDGPITKAIWPEGAVVGAICYQVGDPATKYYVKSVDKPGKTITLLAPVATPHTDPVEWVFTAPQTANSWTLQLRTVDLDGDSFPEISVGDDVSVLPWFDPDSGIQPPLRRLGKVAKVDPATNIITLDKPITLLGVTAQASNDASSKTLTLRITGQATNAANDTKLHFIPLPKGVAVGQKCYLTTDPDTLYTVQAVDTVNHVVTLATAVPTDNSAVPVTWAFNALPPGLAQGQQCYITEEPDTVYTLDTVGPGNTVTLSAPVPLDHTVPVEWTFETASTLIPGGSQVFVGPVYGLIRVSIAVNDWRTAGDTLRAIRGSAAPMRSAPSIGPGQIAYVGADDGLLYAVGPVGPAGFPPQLPALPQRTDVSPWFTFHRDNQRTGYADRQGPVTKDLRWFYDTASTLESSPALGYPDDLSPLGVLYVGTSDERDGQGIPRQRGAMLSVDASSGRLRWRFSDNQAMGKVVSSPAVYVIDREMPDGSVIKDERVVVGTMDMPDFFTSTLTDALRLDDKGFEEFVSVRAAGAQRIMAGDQIIGLSVTDPQNFQAGMEVYLSDPASGSNFEIFGTISSINGSLLRLNTPYVALRNHDLASEVHSQKTQQGHIYCLDRTGTLRWKYPVDGARASERIAPVQSSPVVDSAGNTYFGTLDGVVYALTPDGELLWKYVVPHAGEDEADMEITSSPTLNRLGDRLFIGVSCPSANRGYLLALDPQTADDANRLLWQRKLYVDVNGNGAYDANEPGPVTATPLVSTIEGREVVYVGTDDFNATDGLTGAFFAIDPETGNNAKDVAGAAIPPVVIGPIVSTAAAVPETVTTLYTVDKVSAAGDTIDVKVGATQTIPVKTMRVIIRGQNTTLYRALTDVTQQSEDPVTKVRIYRLTLDTAIDGAATYVSVRTQEQMILVGAQDDPATAVKGDGKLYAFTEDLKPLWNYPTMAPIRTSPAISTEVGLVGDRIRSYTAYFGSNDYNLYAVTCYGATKVLRWVHSMRDRVYASPVVGMKTADQDWARAILYQASRDHFLYAFGDQVGMQNEDIPPTPEPTNNYIPDANNTQPENQVPSTVMVQKSVEYKDGDTNWWKFVITVRNIGRGKVDNLKLYDNLPAELSYPLVDTPDLPGDPAAIPVSGPLNPDEMMVAPINRGTPDKPQWELSWTKIDGTGFALAPDMSDPNQPTTDYKRTFVFYARVRPSSRTYASLGTKMKVTTNGTVMLNDKELVTDAPAKVQMGDSAFVQLFKHPIPAEQGGNIGQNQVVARGKTYAGTTPEDLMVHKETPVASDWTDTFVVRFYYNGFVGPDKRLAPDGAELRTFSPWNYADHETGDPLAFILPYNFKANGMGVANRTMKMFVSAKAAGTATSGVQVPLWASVPQFNMAQIPGAPLKPVIMPYAWRITIQQGRTQLNQKIGDWGPETAFLERIEVGRISGGVPPGANQVRLKTANLAKGQRVEQMKYRRLLFDNPTKPDVEVYVVDITDNPPTPPDVKDMTLTFSRPLGPGEEIEDGAILRDEWTGDLDVLNPVGVAGLQNAQVNLATSMVPGGTAAESTLTVTNVSRWDAQNPYSTRYRIRVTPMDLRLPGNAINWNTRLDDPLQNTGVTFGDAPKAGAIWDGFRYDPYREYHIGMTGDMLDLAEGSALRSNESVRMHVTRRLPLHQPDSGVGYYGTFEENKLQLVNDGIRIFLETNPAENPPVYQPGEDLRLEDLNNNGAWDPGERVFADVDGNGVPGRNEPVFALGNFDVRIFMDMNGDGVWEPGEPYYATAAAGDQFTTPDALPATPLRTVLGVAVQPALSVSNSVLDMGSQPAGALYGLPLQLPTIENPGNQPLTNVRARTSTTLATTGNYAVDLFNMLLRTGSAGVRPIVNPGPPLRVTSIDLRQVEELQPLPFSQDMPANWVVPKGAADDRRDFGRPFELPLKTGYRAASGTYTGDVQLTGAGGEADLWLAARVREQRASQVVPGLSAPPAFDFSYSPVAPNLPPAPPFFNTGWTNYLTGAERSPAAAVLPKMTPTDRDDLGEWVVSNTPIPPQPDLTKLMPANDTDATIWFRRVKHLITDLTGIDTAAPNNRIGIPAATWAQVRAKADPTGDLIILRKKPTVDDPNPTTIWFGQATNAPANGVLDVVPAIVWTVPIDQTEVEILAHPWVPIFTQADLTGIHNLLADPGNPAWTPRPITCATPSVTIDPGGDPWLTWAVSAVRRVTRNGQTNFLPGSYLAYRKFDPADPTSGGVSWISPPDLALQGSGLPKITVREKPVLWPYAWPVAGASAIRGLAFYEGSGIGEARQLYYAFGFIQSELQVTTVTNPAPLPVGDPKHDFTVQVGDDSQLAVGMIIRVGAQLRRIAAINGAQNYVEFTAAITAALNDPVRPTSITAQVMAAGNGTDIQVDSFGDLARGMSIVVDNPTLPDAVLTVIDMKVVGGKNLVTVTMPVRVEANAIVRKYWTLDVPLLALNRAFTTTGAPQVFTDSKNGVADLPPTGINLIFQATASGNTDLYYARLKMDPKPFTDPQGPRPLVLQPLILPDDDVDPATGVVTEALTVNDPTKPMLFTGGRFRAWWLYLDRNTPPDPRRLALTVKTKDGATDTVTLNAWMDLPTLPANFKGELVDQFGAKDPVREYQLEYNGANGKLYRLGFDPYVGTVRVLRQPAAPAKVGDPDFRIDTVSIVGAPRIQRLTSHYAPDVLPQVSVERWRNMDPATGTTDYGPGNSLQLSPRVWLFWTRQHDDTLGPRVYYRTWRMVNSVADPTKTANIVRLNSETRSAANMMNVDMPERMLPMEMLSPDGTATITRMSAGPNSPEAGLWVLTTGSRDLWPPYPNAGEKEMTRHDLFLQVINVAVPDR